MNMSGKTLLSLDFENNVRNIVPMDAVRTLILVSGEKMQHITLR